MPLSEAMGAVACRAKPVSQGGKPIVTQPREVQDITAFKKAFCLGAPRSWAVLAGHDTGATGNTSGFRDAVIGQHHAILP